MNTLIMKSPLGLLELYEERGALVRLSFSPCPEHIDSPTPLLLEASTQLMDYFQGNRTSFDLPLTPGGTPFQQSVWNALCTIPYGETKSYGQIAAQIGNPKGARAVGMANNKNPLPIFIPCHRVIGADRKLVGYAGGLDTKIFLLGLEGNPPFPS